MSMLDKHARNVFDSAILLGSANLPFREIAKINDVPLDFNAAEATRLNRIFPGCDNLNEIELHGQDLLHSLFHADEEFLVSFNPLSGTQANQIVYNAVLEKDSIVLALDPKSGGHSSHIDFIGKYFRVITYGYDAKNQTINYNELEQVCLLHRPSLVIAGCSSFPLKVDYKRISSICKSVSAYLLADISHTALYIMNGEHPNPFECADFITFTTHKSTRGPRGAILAYKREHLELFENSIFPVSQGAPIASQIVSKVLMLEILSSRDITSYSKKMLRYSHIFIEEMLKQGLDIWTGSSDTHLCVLNLGSYTSNSFEVQKNFEKNNILVNACYLPNEAEMTGIRLGFMMLATLNVADEDFMSIVKVIHSLIADHKLSHKTQISDIMNPYYQRFYGKGGYNS
jgi:glycine hydroxymethyltransferase